MFPFFKEFLCGLNTFWWIFPFWLIYLIKLQFTVDKKYLLWRNMPRSCITKCYVLKQVNELMWKNRNFLRSYVNLLFNNHFWFLTCFFRESQSILILKKLANSLVHQFFEIFKSSLMSFSCFSSSKLIGIAEILFKKILISLMRKRVFSHRRSFSIWLVVYPFPTHESYFCFQNGVLERAQCQCFDFHFVHLHVLENCIILSVFSRARENHVVTGSVVLWIIHYCVLFSLLLYKYFAFSASLAWN